MNEKFNELEEIIKKAGYKKYNLCPESLSISIAIPEFHREGWIKLLKRLNAYHGDIFDWKYTEETSELTIRIKENTDVDSNKACNILGEAIKESEYRTGCLGNGTYYDLKLGYSCNNNCIHCVVKPNIMNLKRQNPMDIVIDSGYGMWCRKDLGYAQVIHILRSNEFDKVSAVVLTGGEPTIRKDFVDILKWLYYNRPYVKVILQTNGRNLCNWELAKSVYRYTRNIQFTVAIHGFEASHNYIVNNRKEKGNPYQETLEGIRNIKKLYGDDLDMRLEIVLSNYNYSEVPRVVEYFYDEFGINYFGISYPHMEEYEPEYIMEIAPKMNYLIPMIKELDNFVKKHCDVQLFLEEIPKCVLRQAGATSLLEMPEKKPNFVVRYLDNEQKNFFDIWRSIHAKAPACKKCICNKTCLGVWYENLFLNEDALIPIEE